MIQSIILAVLVIMCLLLLVSLFKQPFESTSNNYCRFKIQSPVYSISDGKKKVSFVIIVQKKHRYFINFPISFKFRSNTEFKSMVRIFYSVPGSPKQKILERYIEFLDKMKEHIVYITDIIEGRFTIDIEIDSDKDDPIIDFQILGNSTCELSKETKLHIRFPKDLKI